MSIWFKVSAIQSISLRDSLRFQFNFATTNKNFKRINKHRNSPLWCKQLLGHLPVHERDQNLRLCIPSYYWWGYYEQLGLDGRNPYLTNISCQMRSLEACLLAGWLWTGHHVSVKHLKWTISEMTSSSLHRIFDEDPGSSSTEQLVSQGSRFKCHTWNYFDLRRIISQSAKGRGQIFDSDKNAFFPSLLSAEF